MGSRGQAGGSRRTPNSPGRTQQSGADMQKLAIDYRENGFAGPIDVLSKAEAAQTLRDVKGELSRDAGARFKLHLILPSVDKIVHNSILLDAVRQALGKERSDDILLWSSDVNTKNAKTPNFFAPHQDCAFAGLQPSSCVLTAWIALTDPVGETEVSVHRTLGP